MLLHSGRLSLVLLGCLFVAGCGSSAASPKVREAQRLYQRFEVQEALDALAGEESPEGHYLKALGLHYRKSHDAAREELAHARKAQPKNLKYRGFELRMELPEGKLETADELIRLYEANPSSPALGLFAFYAHGAKRVYALAQNQPDEARKSSEAGLAAVRNSVALCAEIPELQRELFELAKQFQLTDEIDSLVKKLRVAAPDDADLIMAASAAVAVEEARDYFRRHHESEDAAMVYATALARTTATPAYDQAFEGLARRFSKNTAIASLYAVYLAKSNRLAQAVTFLDQSIARQSDEKIQRHLMRIAVYLPLERGDADVAEENLRRHARAIADPLLVEYFEARILFLRKQHAAAVEKLRRIVDAQRDVVGSSRKLAAEALLWIDKILADAGAIRELEGVSEAVAPATKPTAGPQPEAPDRPRE